MRHEQVAILVLAYIIGFTTAYIAFGISFDPAEGSVTIAEPVPISLYKTTTDNVEANNNTVAGVLFTDSGMFSTLGGEEAVVSGKLTDEIEPGPGFHSAIPFYEVSPDGRFIYYCEQQMNNDAECSDYIYDVANNVIRPIKISGSAVTTSISKQEFVWLPDGTAQYAQFTAIGTETPWKLQ